MGSIWGRKAAALFLGLLFVTSLVSATTVVNSKDWVDVYSGIRYSYDNGNGEAYFVRGPYASGITKIVPKGEPVKILESENQAMAPNLEEKLESRGYNVSRVVRFENANLELGSGRDSYIVVEQDYPSAAVAAAPLAEKLGAWVLIVSDENVDRAVSRLSESDEVWMVGSFSRPVRQAVSPLADHRVIDSNRFNLSVKLTERYLAGQNAERAYVTGGRYLESGMLSGEHPILLTGTNLISRPVKQFLFKDPEHGIDSVIMIGNEMTSVGKDIRDHNITRDGEVTDEKLSVFIKFGTARGDSSQIYSIGLFPIPQGDVNLSVSRVFYNPLQEKLYVTYSNSGSSRVYALTSLRVLRDGEEVATASDSEPVFIGGKDSRTVSYSVELSPGEFRNAVVEFSTSYGESPQNLDTYLTEEGRFSPPVQEDLEVKKVEDSSNVTVRKLSYLTSMDRFRVVVRNTGDVEAYASVSLENVEIQGET
ncbi:MAG: hypothetical protein SVS85_00490, partial [Candidatus Nanohaloarchaea archaeon]|nr:hypothetical protein [Candidatus Nanohaloarchaea archaeon]